MRPLLIRLLLASCLLLPNAPAAIAQACPPSVPVQGAPVLAFPVFPSDNWWNTDIRDAPVDPGSTNFISFIGAARKLHPDFGGEESPGSTAIYGFPYAVVGAAQAKKTVVFDYDDESDGNGIPFYPIPAQAATQAHWIEGGAPGSVDQRDDNDRHLLIVDCGNRTLYELYNVWYDASQAQWHAGSGAFFDLTRSDRRPDGWTSADAAGLAIFPGLVRYDEATSPAPQEINHALRVTLRTSNGYVFPASHRAGSTAGALPMGARLRLKAQVGGEDPINRTQDPIARKIFRAMQKYGLIVADNGSDMYVSGAFDVRWDNDALNPALSSLSAGDFEVIQLGWQPPAATLLSVSARPNPVYGGQASTGTVSLTALAPAGGARVSLSSASNAAFSVPSGVTVPQGASVATFPITTTSRTTRLSATLSAKYAGTTRTTTLTVDPTPPTLSIGDALMVEGNNGQRLMRFTVRLSRPATAMVSFTATTVDVTASAGSDYVAWNRTENIPAGETTGDMIVIAINGDTLKEGNERFVVNLSEAINAVIADGQGTGLIIDDEGRIKMPSAPTTTVEPVMQVNAPAVHSPPILRGVRVKPYLQP